MHLLFLALLCGRAFADPLLESEKPRGLESGPASQVLGELSRPVTIRALAISEKNFQLFLSGLDAPDEEAEYRKARTAGKSPTSLTGPGIQVADYDTTWRNLSPRPLLSLVGYQLRDPAPVTIEGNRQAFVFFTAAKNEAAEACAKTGKPVDSCAEFAAVQEIGLAGKAPGKDWDMLGTVISAANSPDGFSVRTASAFTRGEEIWLYFSTTNPNYVLTHFYRQRLALDGVSKKGPPERLKFEQAPDSLLLEQAQVYGLKCENGARSIFTMVGSRRDRSSIPFFWSEDGLTFRQASLPAIAQAGGQLAEPVQLPIKASPGDCQDFTQKHATKRVLLHSESAGPGKWLLKRTSAEVWVP